MIYDLHSHSIASDGTLTPGELVRRAAEAGITDLALTDHDTVAGIEEAQLAALDHDIRLIPGIELSATWQGKTIHIVGLHLDIDNALLLAGISRQLAFRDWRGREIARCLEKNANIPNAYEGALGFVRGELVGRPHFARYLVAAGYARDFTDAIKRYLLTGRPGYVGGEWATIEEVVTWIHAAGGMAVIAHPARYKLTAAKLCECIDEFVAAGGHAIEVVSGSHTAGDMKSMAGIVLRYQLLASAGSDYHGPENPWVNLGQLPELPAACNPIWDCDNWPGKGRHESVS